MQILVNACEQHTDGTTTRDPEIGCCWDADRLNLWRVGIRPSSRYLSTGTAPGLKEASADLVYSEGPQWADLDDLVVSRVSDSDIPPFRRAARERETLRATPK